MKKVTLTLIAALMVTLLFSLVSAASAQPDSPGAIECTSNIVFDGSHWSGPVTGCELQGTVAYWAVLSEYFDAGKTLHFTETFTIWPSDGGEIHGIHDGVWNASTFKFRANGWITDASEQWSHMVGYKTFEMGTTTSLDVLPVYAENTTMRLAPANTPG